MHKKGGKTTFPNRRWWRPKNRRHLTRSICNFPIFLCCFPSTHPPERDERSEGRAFPGMNRSSVWSDPCFSGAGWVFAWNSAHQYASLAAKGNGWQKHDDRVMVLSCSDSLLLMTVEIVCTKKKPTFIIRDAILVRLGTHSWLILAPPTNRLPSILSVVGFRGCAVSVRGWAVAWCKRARSCNCVLQ